MRIKFLIHPVKLLITFIFFSSTISVVGQNLKISKLPSEIQFNGILTDKTGNVLPNSGYNFTFSIYDSPDSKTPLWKEHHENIQVSNGQFQIAIGKGLDSSPLNLPFDKKYYIGIKINDEEEMTQRLEFGVAPYSLGSKYAETVEDGSITTIKFADNSVTDDKIESVGVNKIINLPASVGSVENFKNLYGIAGSDYEWWTTFGNIIYGLERHFIGTRNDRNFVIQTHEIQRMMFDPTGYILMGTYQDTVDFEVFGMSTFDYLFVQKNLGVGVDPALAKMHINSPDGRMPLKIDYQGGQIFGIDTQGRVSVTSSVGGSDSEIESYPFYVGGGNHGVGIKIDGDANGDMNYVSFWDDNDMVGRIEGQTPGEYAAQPANIATDVYMAALIVAEGVAAVSFLYPLPIPTEPADIIRCAADIAEITFVMIWDLAHCGITYESGSGDYAEWLERENIFEEMIPGDIVAVNGGKISKNTEHAEQFMAISTIPIILGNMPEKKNEHLFEKVAYMGQIPVNVRGIVNQGDYIIPSGLNDGTGIAISPEHMSVNEYSKIVGRAWSSTYNESIKQVNVLVGINSNDMGQLAKKLELNENNLKEINQRNIDDISQLDKSANELKSILTDFENKLTKSISNNQNSNSKIVTTSSGGMK